MLRYRHSQTAIPTAGKVRSVTLSSSKGDAEQRQYQTVAFPHPHYTSPFDGVQGDGRVWCPQEKSVAVVLSIVPNVPNWLGRSSTPSLRTLFAELYFARHTAHTHARAPASRRVIAPHIIGAPRPVRQRSPAGSNRWHGG